MTSFVPGLSFFQPGPMQNFGFQGFQGCGGYAPTTPYQPFPDLNAREELLGANQTLGQGWTGLGGGSQNGNSSFPGTLAGNFPSNGTNVNFSPQTPGLVPAQRTSLGENVQVSNAPGATLLETSRVRVLNRNLPGAGAQLDAQGNLTGPLASTQTLTAAERTDQLFRDKLGNFRYDTPNGKLNIDLDANVAGPQALQRGDIQFNNRQPGATTDPDVVSHEAGHKLLYSLRPGLSNDLATQSTHEALGDSVSLFTSLRDPSVRADLLNRLGRGNTSGLASNIGESLGSGGMGLRDLAGPLPFPGNRDPHIAGKPLSTAVYKSVLDVAGALRQNNGNLSPDQALAQANELVAGDVLRGIQFLPQQGSVGLGRFAQAVLGADQADQGGALSQILARNFQATGVL